MADFEATLQVSLMLEEFEPCWWLCGGWAIDLFLGRVTRAHKDVDIAIARRDQAALQKYFVSRGWMLEIAHDGKLSSWCEGDVIDSPRHTIWCRNAQSVPDFIEVLLNEIDDKSWRFRRDLSIARAGERAFLRGAFDLPILAPEIVLLYKSNDLSAANCWDFSHTWPQLAPDAQKWLCQALQRNNVAHPWLLDREEVL